ncbi:MAG: DUF3341 domain-containing protein [Fibrobacteria bacterium]|nr:DUF3341 domain-containing protein [Fibrobacteria bacterium]
MAEQKNSKLFGVLAEFANPGDLLKAAEKVRDKGYKKWDTHSPFPVHGMDRAMGLKDSKLGIFVFICSMTGMLSAFYLQYWSSKIAYPLVIAGKPFNDYPSFGIWTFEGAILFAAFSALLGMFALNKLPLLYHALFSSKNFLRFSNDAFFISIEAKDPQFNAKETRRFLEEIGGKNIEVIEE